MFDFETPDTADGVTVDPPSGTVVFQDSQGAMSSVTVADFDTETESLDFDFERIGLMAMTTCS